ncbi:MAG: M23 family metallopeptidase [Clostridia bacterium]
MKNVPQMFKKITKNGFYIILFLCITAVGVACYVMFQPTKTPVEVMSGSGDNGYDFESALNNTPVDVPYTPPAVVAQPKPAPKPEAKPAAPKVAAVSKPVSAVEEPSEFVSAVSGKVLIPFSGDELVKSKTFGDWRTHSGVDITAEEGTKVRAISSGTVKKVYADEMMGYTVVIEHADGYTSSYSNLMKGVVAKVGQKVKSGDIIGGVGTSAVAECMEAPHLHLEILKNNVAIDPISMLEGE